jgi:hypothetical protein
VAPAKFNGLHSDLRAPKHPTIWSSLNVLPFVQSSFSTVYVGGLNFKLG